MRAKLFYIVNDLTDSGAVFDDSSILPQHSIPAAVHSLLGILMVTEARAVN
jgi:hypothetical protein